VNESLEDADAVLLILDGQYPKIEQFEAYKNRIKCPLVVVMNKADLVANQDKLQADITVVKEYLSTEHVYAASALENFNINGIIKTLVGLAPEHPAFYDTDSISDENVRFLVSEMIREQILTQFKKEIPYSVEVSVTEYNEKEKLDEIYATINVERDSQKGILLGRGGSAIKNLGIASRKRIAMSNSYNALVILRNNYAYTFNLPLRCRKALFLVGFLYKIRHGLRIAET
jgi:GTP-binding protein Era